MKRSHIGAAVLTLAFVLAGCGSPTSPTNPLNRTQLKAAGLRMIATISGPSGGIVGFRIGLQNDAASTSSLTFSSGQFFDIEVSDRSGDVVWHWSHGKGFTTAFWSLDLEAGQAYTRDATWDMKDDSGRSVPAGTYGCRIWITNSPRDEALVSETSLII
jgi:Intracellular proteinase inhibitor